MASVHRRPSGPARKKVAWTVVWREAGPEGKRVQRTRDFDRRQEAKDFAAMKTALIERRGIGDPGRQTVATFLHQWLDHLRDRGEKSPTTLDGYARHVAKACGIIGHLPLAKLTSLHLDTAYSQLLRQGARARSAEDRAANRRVPLKARSVLHVHRVLHRALGQAKAWKLIGENPAADASPPSPVESEVRAFTQEEVGRLLAVAERDPELYTIVATLLICGLRRSELLGLAFDAVDFEQSTLQIRRAVVEVEHEAVLRDQVKTHRSRRILSIPPVLTSLLREQKRRVAEMMLAWGPEYQREPAFVFPMPDGRPMKPILLTLRLRQLMRRAKVAGPSPVHAWRHTAATLLVGEGVDAKTVATRMGHSTPAITMRLYVHPQDHLDRVAGERLGSLLARRGA